MTSRSFAAVIKELDGDLARVVSSFLPSVFSLLSRGTAAPRDATHFTPFHLLPTINTNKKPLTLVSNSPDLYILPRVEGAGHRRR